MKRTSAHLSRSPSSAAVLVEPCHRSSGSTSVAATVEPLRFREHDGKPSAYTRLYAQGVDQLVHKDRVYQQYGLHKSPPAPSLQQTARITRSSTATGSHIHTSASVAHHTSSPTRLLRTAGSSSSRHMTTRSTSGSRPTTASTSPRHANKASSRSSKATSSIAKKVSSSSAKPQRRQSTIATQLLNKTLKINAAVIHTASPGPSYTNNSTARRPSNASPRQQPRQSMAATAMPLALATGGAIQPQHLDRRLSFHVATTPRPSNCPRSVGKPPASPSKQLEPPVTQPPVFVPVSRRTSSPLVAPNGADFGGMRRRPSVSPIRSTNSPGALIEDPSCASASASRPATIVRRDSKMDRLVEQITVLKNSLGLSDEDLQWKVESTKGNAYEAADRHLSEAEERYDRLVYEIQLLSETPCDEASVALAKRLKQLVAQNNLVAELKSQLTLSQADVAKLKKQLMDQRIASELRLAKSSTGSLSDDGQDDLLTVAQQRLDDAKQRLVTVQHQLTTAMTTLNELLITLSKETDALATACARFQFASSEAADVSAAFVNILRCVPECAGDKLVALCDQGVQTAQRFAGSKAHDLKTKDAELAKTTRDVEVWKARKEQSKEFGYETAKRERQWKETQSGANTQSLRRLRSLIPSDIQQLTVDGLIDKARNLGVLFTYDLAIYIKQNKLLHWLVTHESDIARDNFLAVECASYFLNFTTYDIHELRAVCQILPESFDFDKEGKKAEWKRQLMEHVRTLVKQQQGETIKAGWDPVKGTRAEVPLKPLTEKQLLSAVYRYPTEDEIQSRIGKFELQLQRLAQKKDKFTKLEIHEIPTSKAEYLAIAEDARSEELQLVFGKATLIKLRDEAKAVLQTMNKTRDALKSEIDHSERQWAAQSPSYEQFLDEVAKIRALDPEIRSSAIRGPFPEDLELKPRERAAFKKLSVEEEAQARRQELSQAIADRDKGRSDDAADAEEALTVAAAAAAVSAESSPRETSAEALSLPVGEGEAATATIDKQPDDGSAAALIPAAMEVESASFRRVKSLRVSAEVLRFLQHDFCSPRRTKSNSTLPIHETEVAVASSSSSSHAHVAVRRPSYPKSTETQEPPTKTKPLVPTELPRPKSKALAALLEKQEKATATDGDAAAPPLRPANKMDFLGELKNKANKSSGTAEDARPPMDFLSELKKRAGTNSEKEQPTTERPKKMGFLDELKRATTQNGTESPPPAPVASVSSPRSFLDELKARSKRDPTQ